MLGAGLESDAELAHTDRHGKERDEPADRERAWTKQGGKDELAHPTSREPRQSQARNGGQDTSGGSEEDLGDSARLDGKQSNGETDQVGSACEEDRGSSDVRATQWPARPGEEQYAWEEPRVVADSKREYRGREHKGEQKRKTGGESVKNSNRGGAGNEAQSELGGATNGTACGVDAIANRVDRLRLLGNGVCVPSAELAWKTLWKEMK